LASCVAISPDGKHLAAGGGKFVNGPGEIKLWNLATAAEVRSINLSNGCVAHLAFHRDSRHLAAASLLPQSTYLSGVQAELVDILDVETGKFLLQTGADSDAMVCVAFSPDGGCVASSNVGGAVRLWDAHTGKQIRVFRREGTGESHAVQFSPDGRLLAATNGDGTIQIWDAETGEEFRTLRGHTAPVYGIAFHPRDGRLFSAASDGTIKVWNPIQASEAFIFDGQRQPKPVFQVIFSPNGRLLASSGMGTTIVWDAQTGLQLVSLEEPEIPAGFTPDSRFLVGASRESGLGLWDLETGLQARRIGRRQNAVHAVALSGDGRRLAALSFFENTITIWDVGRGEELCKLNCPASRDPLMAFSPHGSYLAMATDHTATIWDLNNGKQIHTLAGHQSRVIRTLFDLTGERIFTTGLDRTMRIWDRNSGQELARLIGHSSTVIGVTLSPNGRRLATSSADGTIKLWDPASAQEVLTLRGHRKVVHDVLFSPDGQRLASAGEDGTIRQWEAEPVTADSRVKREAAKLVNRLANQFVLKEETRQAIRKIQSLNKATQQEAMQMVDQIRESPKQLLDVSWSICRQTNQTPDDYRLALRQAEAAVRLAGPKPRLPWTYLSTLGVARYRVGDYSGCLEPLRRADAAFADGYSEAVGSVWPEAKRGQAHAQAFLAMAHFKLGHRQEAQAFLERLRRTMALPEWHKNNPDAPGFLREAEDLLRSKPATSSTGKKPSLK
jgi:WD40 repeat protein